MDYSLYQAAATIDVSNWLGAANIWGSQGGSVITDNNTANTINLNGLGNNTVVLATNANYNVTTAFVTINGAYVNDIISGANGLSLIGGAIGTAVETSYSDFLSAAATYLNLDSTGDAFYAVVGGNTYVAMENSTYDGIGQVFELTGYTGTLALASGQIQLGSSATPGNTQANYTSSGLATVGPLYVGNIAIQTGIKHYFCQAFVSGTTGPSGVGTAYAGDVSIGTVNMTHSISASNYVQVYHTASVNYSGSATVGNISVGTISMNNYFGGNDSFIIDNIAKAHGADKMAEVGNMTVSGLLLSGSSSAGNHITLLNNALSYGAAATVGTINLGNIKASGAENRIHVTNCASGSGSQSADMSGLVTVGNVAMSATGMNQQLFINNYANMGVAQGVTVGNVSMVGANQASFTVYNCGITAGNVDIGNVTMNDGNVGLYVSNVARDTVGVTTVGDISLRGSNNTYTYTSSSSFYSYTRNNYIYADGTNVGTMSVGDVTLSARQNQHLSLELTSRARDLSGGITVQDININLANENYAVGFATANLYIATYAGSGGDIVAGDINISSGTNTTSMYRASAHDNAHVGITAHDAGNIIIGNINVTGGNTAYASTADSTGHVVDNFGTLTDLVHLQTTTGTITVGNVDYSLYQAAATIDVSNWLGAANIWGSQGGSTITDNNTANTINLNGLGDNIVNLVSMATNESDAIINLDTIENAAVGDAIGSLTNNSLTSNFVVEVASPDLTHTFAQNFFTAVESTISLGDTHSVLSATDGTNTYIAMENTDHTGINEYVELTGYTGTLLFSSGHIVLASGHNVLPV